MPIILLDNFPLLYFPNIHWHSLEKEGLFIWAKVVEMLNGLAGWILFSSAGWIFVWLIGGPRKEIGGRRMDEFIRRWNALIH